MGNDGIALGDAFVPHGFSGPYLGVEIHFGQQGVRGPLVEPAIIVSACVIRKIVNVVGHFPDDEVKHLFAGRLIGEVDILEVGYDRHVAVKVDENIVVGGAENFQF